MLIYITGFACGALAVIISEVILIVVAAVIYSGRKDKDQCKDAKSEKG